MLNEVCQTTIPYYEYIGAYQQSPGFQEYPSTEIKKTKKKYLALRFWATRYWIPSLGSG